HLQQVYEKNKEERYEYMDRERFEVPMIVREGKHEQAVSEFKGADEEGYRMVQKLNSHKLLLDEVEFLREVMLDIFDNIPIDRIQHDDENRDKDLSEISSKLSKALYG